MSPCIKTIHIHICNIYTFIIHISISTSIDVLI